MHLARGESLHSSSLRDKRYPSTLPDRPRRGKPLESSFYQHHLSTGREQRALSLYLYLQHQELILEFRFDDGQAVEADLRVNKARKAPQLFPEPSVLGAVCLLCSHQADQALKTQDQIREVHACCQHSPHRFSLVSMTSFTFISSIYPSLSSARSRKRVENSSQRRACKTSMTMRSSRRTFLHTAPLLPFLLTESGDIQAELSALASKIPGAGMPDVYYPDFFVGEWLVTRELYAVEVQSGSQEIAGHTLLSHRGIDSQREIIGQRENFPIHFVEHRGHIIEDRQFNARAELGADSVSWERNNPNVLSIAWGRTPGSTRIRECKVTKRSFVDAPQGYGTFVSSEYARVVDVPSEAALVSFSKGPSVYGRRRLVRYRVSSVTDRMEPDGMDRIVVDYIYPPSPPDAKYALLLKYRDFLNRRRANRFLQ